MHDNGIQDSMWTYIQYVHGLTDDCVRVSAYSYTLQNRKPGIEYTEGHINTQYIDIMNVMLERQRGQSHMLSSGQHDLYLYILSSLLSWRDIQGKELNMACYTADAVILVSVISIDNPSILCWLHILICRAVASPR